MSRLSLRVRPVKIMSHLRRVFAVVAMPLAISVLLQVNNGEGASIWIVILAVSLGLFSIWLGVDALKTFGALPTATFNLSAEGISVRTPIRGSRVKPNGHFAIGRPVQLVGLLAGAGAGSRFTYHLTQGENEALFSASGPLREGHIAKLQEFFAAAGTPLNLEIDYSKSPPGPQMVDLTADTPASLTVPVVDGNLLIVAGAMDGKKDLGWGLPPANNGYVRIPVSAPGSARALIGHFGPPEGAKLIATYAMISNWPMFWIAGPGRRARVCLTLKSKPATVTFWQAPEGSSLDLMVQFG